MGAAGSVNSAAQLLNDDEVTQLMSCVRDAGTKKTMELKNIVEPTAISDEAFDMSFIQLIEQRFNLEQNSFVGLIKPPSSPVIASESGADEISSVVMDEEGSEEKEVDEEEDEPPSPLEEEYGIVHSTVTAEELSALMSSSGWPVDDSNADNITKLHTGMVELMMSKDHTIKKKSQVAADENWKAIELMGDERLFKEKRDAPLINAGNAKALSKLGTTKAIESKKVRDRLGSDMSLNQVKKQAVYDLREKKRAMSQDSIASAASKDAAPAPAAEAPAKVIE
jgi:hypothetical protein